MNRKYFIFSACLLLFCSNLFAQRKDKLSLSEAYLLLEKQYPVLQNGSILSQIHQKELEKLDIAKKPSLDWVADGRLQSESVSLDTEEGVMLPFEINQPLVNIKTYVEANYTILDGGINEAQRKLKEVQLHVDQQSLEVERFALRERINSLFVNISLLRQQRKLLDFSLQDLDIRKIRITAGLEFGIMLESELTKVEVKILELKAQEDNLSFRIEGLIKTLAQLIGEKLSEEVVLDFPKMDAPEILPAIDRPEYELFEVQRTAILAQSDLVNAQKKPKLGAYAQAGIGYPNPLNILDNNIAPFGVVGARFNWKITDWKKSKVEKEILSLQAQQLINAEATLDFNLQSKEANYLANVQRLKTLIKNDEAIAKLQIEILKQLAAQLDEGVITSSEYIAQVNTELRARQNIVIHQTELLNTQLVFLNERGSLD